MLKEFFYLCLPVSFLITSNVLHDITTQLSLPAATCCKWQFAEEDWLLCVFVIVTVILL